MQLFYSMTDFTVGIQIVLAFLVKSIIHFLKRGVALVSPWKMGIIKFGGRSPDILFMGRYEIPECCPFIYSHVLSY